MVRLKSSYLLGLAKSSFLGLNIQGTMVSPLSWYLLSLPDSSLISLQVQEHMADLLSRFLLGVIESRFVSLHVHGNMVKWVFKVPAWPSRHLICWSPGPWAHGESGVQVPAWPSGKLSICPLGTKAHGNASVELNHFTDTSWDAGLMVSWHLANLFSGIPCLVLHWASHLVVWRLLVHPVSVWLICPVSNGIRSLPVFGSLGRALSWVLNVSFLGCVWGLMVCGLWDNQVSGELFCPLLSWFRQSMDWGPVFQGLTLHTEMWWFFFPVPTCFVKFPLCLMSPDIPHIVHIWVGWMFRVLMCPLLSQVGGLHSSSMPNVPSGRGLNFPVLKTHMTPGVWGPACWESMVFW